MDGVEIRVPAHFTSLSYIDENQARHCVDVTNFEEGDKCIVVEHLESGDVYKLDSTYGPHARHCTKEEEGGYMSTISCIIFLFL